MFIRLARDCYHGSESGFFYTSTHNVSPFLPLRGRRGHDRHPDRVLSHVVQDPDVADRVRYERVDDHDEVEEQELKVKVVQSSVVWCNNNI